MAFAVFSNWGRKGIGTRLLQSAEQLDGKTVDWMEKVSDEQYLA